MSWNITDLQGSIVATTPGDSTTPTVGTSWTEYGTPRDPTKAGMYGWLGSHQRSTDTLGGLTLMGVRLYNPTTGRFLSPDPVYAANANPYTYPTDPMDTADTTGAIPVAVWVACRIWCDDLIVWASRGIKALTIYKRVAGSPKAAHALFTPAMRKAFLSKKSGRKGSLYYKGKTWGYEISYKAGPFMYVWKWGITAVGKSKPRKQLPTCRKRMDSPLCDITDWRRFDNTIQARIWERSNCLRYLSAVGRRPFGMPVC